MAEIVTEARFEAKDAGASSVADKINKSYTQAARGAESLTSRINGLARGLLVAGAAGLGFGFGIRAVLSKVLESNIELGRMQKQITGTQFAFQSWNASLSTIQRVSISLREATAVSDELEKAETRLAIPMTELGNVYRMVAGPAFQRLGLNQEQVVKLTMRAAEASKVYGVSGEFAATAITRALITGKVRGFDPFSVAMRDLLGNTKNLAAPELYKRIEGGLKNLGPAAEGMSQGLDDTIFRIKDLLADTLRDVGMPTIKHIAVLLREWGHHLNSTVEGGKKVVEIYGERVLSIFQKIEKVVGFISEHWRVIVAGLATAKLGSLAGSIGGAVAGAGGLAGAAKSVGVGGALTALAVGGQVLADAVNDWHDAKEDVKADSEGFKMAVDYLRVSASKYKEIMDASYLPSEELSKVQKQAAEASRIGLKIAQQFGAVTKEGTVSMEYLTKHVGAATADFVKQMLESASAVERMNKLPQGFGVLADTWDMRKNLEDHPSNVAKHITNFTGDIHITQDFKDQDPDRVFLAFKEGLEGLSEKALQSNLSGLQQGL